MDRGRLSTWEAGNGQGKMEEVCHVELKAAARRKGLGSSSDLKLSGARQILSGKSFAFLTVGQP